jgi:putative ATP-dependent endonuclease of OLD family
MVAVLDTRRSPMKIKRIKIEHFRSWKSATIEIDQYNCFVGVNGAGKSAVLCALNLFFRHTQNSPTNVLNLHEEDFYRKDTSQPIRVTVTFDDLSSEAQEDLKAYYRQGELTFIPRPSGMRLRRPRLASTTESAAS